MTLIVIENIKRIDPRTGKQYEDVRFTETQDGDLRLDRRSPPLTIARGIRKGEDQILLGRVKLQTILGVVLYEFDTETSDIPIQSYILVPEKRADQIWVGNENNLTYLKINDVIYLSTSVIGVTVERGLVVGEDRETVHLTLSNTFGSWFEDTSSDKIPKCESEWYQVKCVRTINHGFGGVITDFGDDRIVKLIGNFLELPPNLHPTFGDM